MEEFEAGRVAAFQKLADERLEASYRLANAILGDQGQSQDAVHDAVVVAWQRWASLRDEAKFDAWFDRIVVNVCRKRLRSAKYRRTLVHRIAPEQSGPDTTTEVHQRLLVEQALAMLKPDDVVVIALRYLLDLELADVAVLLDIPLQTANSRLRSARARLRDLLQDQPSSQVSP